MRLTRREFAAGLAAGIAAPYVITAANARASTIKIGIVLTLIGITLVEHGRCAQFFQSR